jgi:acyl carrier protein
MRPLIFGPTPPAERLDMTRDEVAQIIENNMIEHLDGIEKEDLEMAESFRDLGANSLDMLDIVTSTMRELDIKIPRSELADVESVDQLADKFMEYI